MNPLDSQNGTDGATVTVDVPNDADWCSTAISTLHRALDGDDYLTVRLPCLTLWWRQLLAILLVVFSYGDKHAPFELIHGHLSLCRKLQVHADNVDHACTIRQWWHTRTDNEPLCLTVKRICVQHSCNQLVHHDALLWKALRFLPHRRWALQIPLPWTSLHNEVINYIENELLLIRAGHVHASLLGHKLPDLLRR